MDTQHEHQVYQWTLLSAHNRQSSLMHDAMYGLGMSLLILGALYLLDIIASSLAVLIGYVLFTVPLLLVVQNLWRLVVKRDHLQQIDPVLWQIVNGSAIYLMTAQDSLASQGFDMSDTNRAFGDWLLFIGDNLISVFCFDINEIYDIQLSPISPTTGLARFVNVVFRFSIAAGFIDLIYSYMSKGPQAYRYGTKSEIKAELSNLPIDQSLQLLGVVQLIHSEPQTHEQFTVEDRIN